MVDSNITEIRRIVKVILKKNNLDPKEHKFKVSYVSFADLANDGKYFVKFDSLSNINPLDLRIKLMDEIEKTGKEEDFKLSHSIIGFKEDWLKCQNILFPQKKK